MMLTDVHGPDTGDKPMAASDRTTYEPPSISVYDTVDGAVGTCFMLIS